jgi:hypothetical protein
MTGSQDYPDKRSVQSSVTTVIQTHKVRSAGDNSDFPRSFRLSCPVASITRIFLGSFNTNCTFQMFFIITITYPLDVSGPTGHIQVGNIYIYIYILVT